MRILRRSLSICILAAIAFAASPTAIAQNRSDRNLAIMLDASRQLDFALPENRAYVLARKSALARSEIGVIFGYVDNHAACQEIASALTANLQAGTFECDAIDQ